MATGLFDTAATVHEDASSPETEEYRALSGTAVFSRTLPRLLSIIASKPPSQPLPTGPKAMV